MTKYMRKDDQYKFRCDKICIHGQNMTKHKLKNRYQATAFFSTDW